MLSSADIKKLKSLADSEKVNITVNGKNLEVEYKGQDFRIPLFLSINTANELSQAGDDVVKILTILAGEEFVKTVPTQVATKVNEAYQEAQEILNGVELGK